MGIELCANHIRTINGIYNKRYELKIIDLLDNDSKPAGTRAEIIMPV
jgi:hypothetical protein